MIKFFRKIRQNLLMENKTGKYFKYAIGEIVLVVIGILIALQINNWNQNRLKKIQVNTYLKSITTDLKSDISLYQLSIDTYEKHIENISQVLSNSEYKQLKVDSIYTLITRTWGTNLIKTQTYEKIKSTGLQDILGTVEIDNAVNDYYGESTTHFDYYVNWNAEMTNRDDLFWNYADNFESGILERVNSTSIPYQQDSIKRKEELVQLIESTLGRNYLKNALSRDVYGIRIIENFKSKADNLVELIEKQIDK
ncbi:DUF6090 family protein [Ichthyenterobacterium sp. W332]|uniref:DUF6090 family protein n=1 Tax=Microcosmobacter mediterraneus TaxID=3075607 RepID=A0ABU2YNY5_9FLAO|nr:DUF6090 family protein [Ichthyenterobacterium sp. W332]MDT0559547.1 DUF6090 family protein [Ichthyenterobacterium sp. W332]